MRSTRTARAAHLPAALLLACLLPTGLLPPACVAPASDRWPANHLDGENWTAGLAQELHDPGQVVPASVLAASLGVLSLRDRDIQRRLARDPILTNGDTKIGDLTMTGLVGLSVGVSGWQAMTGDGGRSLEVTAESLIATGLTVSILKKAIGRHRPDGPGRNSMPSGHAAASFSAATLLARTIEDRWDSPWSWSGYLFYLPATLVAVNRVEGNRHFPTDVAAGALLGVVLTNAIYNAHYGDGNGKGGIFGNERISLYPLLGPQETGLALAVRF